MSSWATPARVDPVGLTSGAITVDIEDALDAVLSTVSALYTFCGGG